MDSLRLGILSLAHNSSQAFVSILAFVVGFRAMFLTVWETGSVYFLLPPWAFYIWAGGLMLGGVLVILGILFVSAHTERAGLSALVGAGSIYVISMIAFHFFTIPVFLIWMSLVIAMAVRYWALGQVPMKLRRRG